MRLLEDRVEDKKVCRFCEESAVKCALRWNCDVIPSQTCTLPSRELSTTI